MYVSFFFFLFSFFYWQPAGSQNNTNAEKEGSFGPLLPEFWQYRIDTTETPSLEQKIKIDRRRTLANKKNCNVVHKNHPDSCPL